MLQADLLPLVSVPEASALASGNTPVTDSGKANALVVIIAIA